MKPLNRSKCVLYHIYIALHLCMLRYMNMSYSLMYIRMYLCSYIYENGKTLHKLYNKSVSKRIVQHILCIANEFSYSLFIALDTSIAKKYHTSFYVETFLDSFLSHLFSFFLFSFFLFFVTAWFMFIFFSIFPHLFVLLLVCTKKSKEAKKKKL